MTYEDGRATLADASRFHTRDGFADFLIDVLEDFRATGVAEWENGTLERFLDGLEAFSRSRVLGKPRDDQETASWQLFADMVVVATGYE
jgi:hypothetical protein